MHPTRLLRVLPHLRLSRACSSSPPPPAAAPVLALGDVLRETRRFSAADVAAYAAVTGDRNPVHFDDEFAKTVGGFEKGCVVHGMLVASLFPSVIASHFPGAIYHSQTLYFKLPVYIGDVVVAEVQATNFRSNKDKTIVKFRTRCITNGEHLSLDAVWEQERTKLREKHWRAITTRILTGLQRHMNYNPRVRANINEAVGTLAREVGWTMLPDGTTFPARSQDGTTLL